MDALESRGIRSSAPRVLGEGGQLIALLRLSRLAWKSIVPLSLRLM
jgi:hypothetical protein